MKTLKLWLWSMKAPRSAAMSMSERIFISQHVRYSALRSAGISGMFWTEPLCAMI